jgi:hypothetical protein
MAKLDACYSASAWRAHHPATSPELRRERLMKVMVATLMPLRLHLI